MRFCSHLQRFAGLTLCIASLLYVPATAQTIDSHAAQVDAIFAPWDRSDTPGATVEVIQDGTIVFQRGYGMADLEQGSPNRPETVFSLASMSKQFTATAVALLVEGGKLRLDQDVRSIVPELPDYGHVITVDNLIHHTSGLRDYLYLWSLSGRSLTDSIPEEQMLALICRQKGLNHEPGARYLYSNTDYQLLALIVQRVSGQPLRLFAEQHIFAPLGMRHTHFHDDVTRIVPFVSAPYDRHADGSYGLVRTQVALTGAGKLYSTVGDLALWDANFSNNRLGSGGPKLIEQMLTPGRLSNGQATNYAFGLDVTTYRGLPVVQHSGGSVGISTMMMHFPQQRLSIFVLGNVAQLRANVLAEDIADIYLGTALHEPKPARSPYVAPDDTKQGPAHWTATQFKAIAGVYHSAELDADYRISANGEAATVKLGSYLRAAVFPLDHDRFLLISPPYSEHPSGRLTRDAKGNIDGFVLDADQIKQLRFTRFAEASIAVGP